MKRNGLVLAIFSLLLRFSVQAQSPADCLKLARQAYETDNYAFALELYERVLFFQREVVDREHFERIAQCYVALQQFDKATVAYQTSASLAPSDSARSAYFLKSAWCQLMMNSFQDALIVLYNLPEDLPATLQREKHFYIGLATFQLGQYEDAHTAFRAYFSNPADVQWVDDLFKKNSRLARRYNPRTARTLSIIVPGSGQFYAGDIKNGFNSLLLMSGIIALGVNYMATYTWFDSLVSIAPWFQRYYFGGFKRAGQAATDRLNKEREKLLKQLIEHA